MSFLKHKIYNWVFVSRQFSVETINFFVLSLFVFSIKARKSYNVWYINPISEKGSINRGLLVEANLFVSDKYEKRKKKANDSSRSWTKQLSHHIEFYHIFIKLIDRRAYPITDLLKKLS